MCKNSSMTVGDWCSSRVHSRWAVLDLLQLLAFLLLLPRALLQWQLRQNLLLLRLLMLLPRNLLLWRLSSICWLLLHLISMNLLLRRMLLLVLLQVFMLL